MNLGPIKDKSEREKKSISKLLGKQGLYAIVFVCVAAIGITCAVALTGDKQPSGEVERPKSTATVQQMANQTAKPTSQNTVRPTSPQSTQTEKPASGNGDVEVSMHNPVNSSKLAKGHAVESLVYSETLNMWSTHAGVDIICDEGAEIFSVLDGTVVSAESDPLMGNKVVLSHAGGLKTVYASLGSIAENLKAGDTVRRGQVIGQAGNSAINESAEGNHLHFEVIQIETKDGQEVEKALNPEDYLSGLSK